MSQDAELARAFQEKGDSEAFGELIERNQERLYHLAYRITGDSDDALDVVQEVFVKIYHAIAGWDGRSSFYTWCYRITTNVAIDHVRRRGRDRKARETLLRRHGDALVLAADAPCGIEAEERAQLLETVHEAIGELPPGQRCIVALRHYEGLSMAEIAEVRGCAVGTVKSTLHQAFRKLRDALKRDAAERFGIVTEGRDAKAR
jgi:RNA polymerase sigma-70 factor, ECF subfamily